MFKGGYKIIDFRKTPFVSGGAENTIDGIYDAIEASYEKPLMLAGLNIDGVEYNAAYVVPDLISSEYIFTVYGYTITVRSIDRVYVDYADEEEE